MLPAISVVVASNRAWALPDLYARFDVQDYPFKELVVVHSDDEDGWVPPKPPEGLRIRVLDDCSSDLVGDKFEHGIQHASGDLVAIRSDDSIWHPHQLMFLATGWLKQQEPPYYGWGHGWFYDPFRYLRQDACLQYFQTSWPIPSAMVVTREAAQAVSFRRGDGTVPRRASDTAFLRNLMQRFGERRPTADTTLPYGLWVTHRTNLSARKYAYHGLLRSLESPALAAAAVALAERWQRLGRL